MTASGKLGPIFCHFSSLCRLNLVKHSIDFIQTHCRDLNEIRITLCAQWLLELQNKEPNVFRTVF